MSTCTISAMWGFKRGPATGIKGGVSWERYINIEEMVKVVDSTK